MVSRILARFVNRKNFFFGSAVLSATTVLSYALGLLRDRMLATKFGASIYLDAYNAAFTLPDLILNIFVAGALTAAFVPIFSDLKNSNRHGEASDFINSVISSSLFVVIIAGTLVFIFAPFLSKYVVPGFDETSRDIFVNLVRILLLSPIIFSISNTIGNINLTHEKYFWYGISASLYNVGIIFGAIFLAPHFGIYGVAIGTVIGALLHLISRLIGLSYPYKYRPKISFNHNYRTFIKLMLPKVIGQPLEQITFLGYTIIASTIGAGSIAIMNFARNFQSMPVNVIGITLALTAFPVLTRLSARESQREFRNEIKFTLFTVLLITIPSAFAVYFLRNYLIAIFLGGGMFDSEAIRLTGATLGMLAISIPTESMTHLISRGFYALKDSLTPVVVGLMGLITAIVFGYLFSKSMGIEGLALGFVFGSILKTIALYILLLKKSWHLSK